MEPTSTCFCLEQVCGGRGDGDQQERGKGGGDAGSQCCRMEIAKGLVAGGGVRIIRFPT